MAELMKGHKWSERKHKMTYPAWVEVKQDEIRCHVIIKQSSLGPAPHYLSYAGKPLSNLSQFDAQFIALYKETGYTEFDCGFEANGNFNDSYRWVRSSKGIPEDLKDASTVFYLYDLPELVHMAYNERSICRHIVRINAIVVGLPMNAPAGKWANSAYEVEQLFMEARDAGQEGIMVKSLDHMYERGKRSNGWLKLKPENDADGVIVEIIEAVSEAGVPLGRAGSVRIKVEDGSEATPHGIDHDLGADMFQNPEKYLGEWAEFRYMERDRAGGYRHPVWGRLREAKK